MIIIVDYGVGNLNSVANIINHVGGECIISSDPRVISEANKLILPGVGSFDNGMNSLTQSGILNALNYAVLDRKVPILGICLGMQLMTTESEEGDLKGLGWIDAQVIKFSFDSDSDLKIPHMGWNSLEIKQDNPILPMNNSDLRFYFVHSYFVRTNQIDNMIASTTYGNEFCVAFQKNNIFGVQFHPEKSHKFGMSLMKNFINI